LMEKPFNSVFSILVSPYLTTIGIIPNPLLLFL
jgi:hypothetical protein